MEEATELRGQKKKRQRVAGWLRVPGLDALVKIVHNMGSKRDTSGASAPGAGHSLMVPVRYESGDRAWVQVARIAEIRESWSASGARHAEVVLRDPREHAESTAVVERDPDELAAELNGGSTRCDVAVAGATGGLN
jgi:hypothetical protein